MIKYSIIIPTRNRENNLACCLMALLMQTYSPRYWEIIIADESDRMPWQIVGAYTKELNIRYFWQKGKTGNPGPAKNIAAKMAMGEALIFVDSDVILNNEALRFYDELHTEYPEAIICGRYDWLLPMRVGPHDVAKCFDKVVSNGLPRDAPVMPGPLPGIDPRFQDERTRKWDKPSNISPVTGKPFALGMFGGNILIPKKLFYKSGGFDPQIRFHGGEDCELGWKMQSLGAKAMFTEKTIGWHIHHERNQEKNEQSVKNNIRYIEKKYRDLHIKHGVIADPDMNMIYNDDGTFVPPEKQRELKIKNAKRDLNK